MDGLITWIIADVNNRTAWVSCLTLYDDDVKKFRMPQLKTTIVFTLAILAAFAVGWSLSRAVTLTEVSKNVARPVRYSDPEYPRISPLVSVVIPEAKGFPELYKAKNDVQQIIRDATMRGDVSDVGVYFRLPSNAHWFGIHEDVKFGPGSLIKVPIMMAVLKKAESNSRLLEEKLYYNSALVADIPDALPAQLKTGQYSAEELLRAMIIQSDNVAKEVLFNLVGIGALQNVFTDMKIDFLEDPSGTISAKSYTTILSRIYNATYLDRDYSNYAMDLLTQTTYVDGLVAGLPKGVRVAHKYGESGIYKDKVLTEVELHDCGLIYVPDSPYYLCVMTRGKNTAALAQLIQNISEAIYADRASFKPIQ